MGAIASHNLLLDYSHSGLDMGFDKNVPSVLDIKCTVDYSTVCANSSVVFRLWGCTHQKLAFTNVSNKRKQWVYTE